MTAKHRSAKVHWRIGQPLLPEHFHSQEESLRLERQRILESISLPIFGVAELVWDELQLANGIVMIESMLVFLRNGEIVDVPGNTLSPRNFNLTEVEAARVTLYLLLESGPAIIGSSRAGDEDEEGIERAVQRVVLSKESHRDGTVASFELGVFVKDTDETWSLAKDWLPPLVRLKRSPYFGSTLARIRMQIDVFEQLLRDDIHEDFLSSETLLAASQALKGVYRFSAMLSDIDRGSVDAHPYTLYCGLRQLYIELCIYREVQPDARMVYEHGALFSSFDRMLCAVEEQLERERHERPYAPFVMQGGLRYCELTSSAKRARDVFWIVERPSASTTVDISGIKLASRSRIPIVHTHALRGIPFTVLPNPPFRHGFSSQVEFYTLEPGREWDYAVQEGGLAFVDSQALDGLRTFLYWRDEPKTSSSP